MRKIMFCVARNEEFFVFLAIAITIVSATMFFMGSTKALWLLIIPILIMPTVDYCVRYKIRKLITFRKKNYPKKR